MDTANVSVVRNGQWRRAGSVLVLMVVCLAHASTAPATSVLQMSLDDMLRDSELVFEGRVVRLEPRLDSRSGSIRTFVTFEILDLIKHDGYFGS